MLGFHRFAYCTFMLALLVIPTRLAFAQGTGSVLGIVQDPDGDSVPGAHITARNLETNRVYQTVSSELGTFSFPFLLVGNYEFTGNADGFRPAVTPPVAVHPSFSAPVKIRLELAGVVEQVTVLAEGQQMINTASPELTALVDRRQMRDLPSFGRDAMSLLRQQAGVAVPSGTDLSSGSIHGLRGNMINI